LHVEKVRDRLIETIRPQMPAPLSFDHLHVDAHPITAPLHASFEHVAYVEFASDLFEIRRFAFVGKGGAAADSESAGKA
jgi:hypothetical protein